MNLVQKTNVAIRKVPTWVVYALGTVLPIYYFYLGLTGGLGVEPVNGLERALGELAIKALVIVLALTPIRRVTGISFMPHRRALGLIVFFYVVCHLAAWALLDVQDPSRIWADIVKRPYITIGMVAFLLLVPLALTSNNYSVRRLGPLRWRRLHLLGYVAALLAAVHYVMVQKTWQVEPLVYVFIVAVLIATRGSVLRRAFAH